MLYVLMDTSFPTNSVLLKDRTWFIISYSQGLISDGQSLLN